MRYTAGIVSTAAGIVMILLGLLFLVGAGGQIRRVVIGAAALALGAVAAGVGVRVCRRADASSPRQLRAEILQLAARHSGEVSEDDLRAALGRRFEGAQGVLQELAAAGTCRRQLDDGALYYLFPELQPRLLHLVCEYCHSELPISQETDQCPSCGGTVKTRVARHALSGDDYFSMDET